MAADDPIPTLDLTPEITEYWDQLVVAVTDVLRSGQFILGPQVAAFEDELARYLGVEHAVGVNSGTDALVLALRALGVGEGDEVITTPFTFFATAEAISNVRATPVFVDIDEASFNLDADQVETAVTPATKAVLPVHLYGHAADMGTIMQIASEHGLLVIEDTAQALGAEWRGRKLGTIGNVGAFSFFPSKNLGGFGDGGLIAAGDGDLAARLRALRTHGARRKYQNEALGYNSRLDEIQAALLRVKLPRLDAANEGRRRVAGAYASLLDGVDGVVCPSSPPDATHVFHQYTVRVTDGRRDDVVGALAAQGISTAVYYPVPVHRLPVYAATAPELPTAERVAAEVLSLPIWPSMSERLVARVARTLREALAG